MYIDEKPVMVAMMDYNTERIGNHLGNYFDDLACARSTGMHFVGVFSRLLHGQDDRVSVFWNEIPTIVLHDHPSDNYTAALALVKTTCRCARYCWNGEDPWRDHLGYIKSIMSKAIDMHLDVIQVNNTKLRHMNHLVRASIDMTTAAAGTRFPLFPDFGIHYRCSDNLYGGMGLISFGSIIGLIPSDAKYVYIFTEYGNRLVNTPMAHAADEILSTLMKVIKHAFPLTTVVVTRGGDVFTVWSQLARSKVLLCSPSTFCLWPALARGDLLTYMPGTDYIAYDHRTATNADLGDTWKWIRNPRIYNNFTTQTPTAMIIDTLMADVPFRLTARHRHQFRRRI